MYVLLDANSGGVYAVNSDITNNKTVQIFVDKDDAERYNMMLEALDYKRTLEITEVDLDVVVQNCQHHHYDYVVIQPDDVVVPPL